MRRFLLLCVVATGVACGACQKPGKRLNAPPHGSSTEDSQLRSTYAHMVDNALLADMTVSDVHFRPHRAALNSLGEERLCRLALLMEAYGGQIRFSTNVTDRELFEQRTEEILAFLAEAGIDTSVEVLVHDLPGGDGMDAVQCVLIKQHEAMYTPKKDENGSKRK